MHSLVEEAFHWKKGLRVHNLPLLPVFLLPVCKWKCDQPASCSIILLHNAFPAMVDCIPLECKQKQAFSLKQVEMGFPRADRLARLDRVVISEYREQRRPFVNVCCWHGHCHAKDSKASAPWGWPLWGLAMSWPFGPNTHAEVWVNRVYWCPPSERRQHYLILAFLYPCLCVCPFFIPSGLVVRIEGLKPYESC